VDSSRTGPAGLDDDRLTSKSDIVMKGSFARCKYCGGEELKVNRANETIQCESCDHILEERYNDYRVTPIFLERESPFYVVTDDVLSKYR
jgi:hypothetical protein